MGILKFLGGCLLIGLGIWIGIKGFYLPNSAAADLCFGTGFILGLLGFSLWAM